MERCGKTPVAQHYKNEKNSARARNACEFIEMDAGQKIFKSFGRPFSEIDTAEFDIVFSAETSRVERGKF